MFSISSCPTIMWPRADYMPVCSPGTGKSLKDYKAGLASDAEIGAKVADLKTRVRQFAGQYPMPGFDDH